MPKKQKQRFSAFRGSSSYVHPSLVAKGGGTQSLVGEKASTSVNARIEHLRRTQGLTGHPPETQGMYSSQHAPLPPGRRRAAGLPPPRSWLVDSNSVSFTGDDVDYLSQQRPRLNRLPGTSMPCKGTLLDLTLRSMAINFDWHLAFDHVYLSILPVELKTQLLSYIAIHNARGLSKEGIEKLFVEPTASGLEGSTGSADVSRLDLAGSIGRSLSLTDLHRLWTRKGRSKQSRMKPSELLDSWEDDMDLNSLSLTSSLQFPRLTRLSLSHPSKTVSWQDLITFSAQLGSLTHLCLDFWPRPYLPDLQPAQAHERIILSDEPVVGMSQTRQKEQEAEVILRVLSRNTPSLRWLSFAGCQIWYDALLPQDDVQAPDGADARLLNRSRDLETALPGLARSNRLAAVDREIMSTRAHQHGKGPDWNGCWRQVRYVNVGQDWITAGLKSDDLIRIVIPRKARSASREALRAEPFQLPRDRETYRLSSNSDEVQRSVEEGLRRRRWLLMERMSILLASKVDWKRLTVGLPTAEFDFGWGRRELLETGYEEQVVFDAGL